MRAVALEREHRVDHMLDHARAGDLAVLGHVPDQQQSRAARLGEADQRLRRAAHLADRPGRRFDRVAPHGLNRIDDHELRRVARAKRRHDILDEGLRRELHRRLGKPEPGRAQTHLGSQFLARDVDDAAARPGDRRAGLDQEGRLADARLAADQRGRAGHEPAAGHPIQLGDAGDEARLGLGRARQILKGERPSCGSSTSRCAAPADAERGSFLDDRVPLAARFAFALPALGDGAAILADIRRTKLRHRAALAGLPGPVERLRCRFAASAPGAPTPALTTR